MLGDSLMNTEFAEVLSVDSCPIRYEVTGAGPVIILVDGALCSRGIGPSSTMSRMLVSQGFRVARFDRRGRGESGTVAPYAVEREIDDIAAIARQLGGKVSLWGMSSGGILALLAGSRVPGVQRIAVYEAPVLFDASRPLMTKHWHTISACLARQDPDGALKSFLTMVGMPAPVRLIMTMLPIWQKLRAIAPTLLHDRDITAPFQRGETVSIDSVADISGQILVMAGDKSQPWLTVNNHALARLLPGATYAVVKGDDHMVRPARHRELLTDFFRAAD